MLPRRMLARPASAVLPLRPGYRQSPSIATIIRPLGRRWASGESGEDGSGHISTSPDQNIFFFNNLPPGFLGFLRFTAPLESRSNILENRLALSDSDPASPLKIIDEVTKNGAFGNVKVVDVVQRWREGGAYVKLSHDATTDIRSVEEAVREHLRKNPVRPWWNPFHRIRVRLVIGKPWIEDLMKTPSARLRVEFLPTEPGGTCAELSQEQLYSFFRPYGKLADITAQPTDSKIMPRYSIIDFWHARNAVMAKNCLHGYTVPHSEGGGKLGTIFRITYQKKERFGWFKDWIYNHPRIAIPLIAALVAAISIIIFDPIRRLSIRTHITRAFHIEDNIVFRWFRRRSADFIKSIASFRNGGNNPEAGMQVVWDDRKNEIEQIQSWLMESANTFIVVMGPRGSGKREMVYDLALQHKREAHKVLLVDCKPIQEARGDTATIAAAAAEVGYRPVFSWVNNISGLIDLASQSMTGVKAGFSETLDAQLSKIFNTASAALKSIALEGRRKTDQDANLSDDEYLEAHPELRPVVVIDKFLHRNDASAQVIYDKIAQWGAELTASNIAHPIFLTSDIGYGKTLSKALPDRVFRQITLSDCSPEVAKRYVVRHLDFDTDPGKVVQKPESEETEAVALTPSQKREDLHELDAVIELLGGRLTDLEFLARRIKAGETPTKAVKEIIDQSASEVLKMFLLADDARGWSCQQAWMLVKNLSRKQSLRYNEVLMSTAFKSGGEKALAAMEQAELISVQSHNGRPYSVKAGKPVYQSAFKQLVSDKVLAAKMNLAELNEAIATEGKSIAQYEQELSLIGELPKQPGELRARVQWLLDKLAASQTKIESLEKETGDLKKILTSEY